MDEWIRQHPRTTYWICAWATVVLLLQLVTMIRVLTA